MGHDDVAPAGGASSSNHSDEVSANRLALLKIARRLLVSVAAAARVAALLWLGQSHAADSASSPAAAASAASAPAQRSTGEIVAQMLASESLQRGALERLPGAQQWQALEQRTAQVEAAFARVVPVGEAGDTTEKLVGLSHDVWVLGNESETNVRDLSALVHRIERDAAALERDAALWRENVPILHQGQVPARVIDGAQAMTVQAEEVAARMRKARDEGLIALVRAQTVQTRIRDATEQVAARMTQVMAQRSRLESVAIWNLGAAPGQASSPPARLGVSAALLRGYLAREGAQLALLFGAVFLLCNWLFRRASKPGASPASRAYGKPIAASLLIALVAAFWLAPNPPVLFYSLLMIVMPVPMALVGRRSFAARIPRTLYGMAAATALLALRSVVDASEFIDRLLLIAEIGCFTLALVLDLRGGQLAQAFARWSPDSVRAVVLLAIGVALLSALHVVFGIVGPTRMLRVGFAGLLGFGLVFGTAALLVYGALRSLMGTPLLAWLLSARHADPALLRALRVVLALLAAAATATATLGAMTLVPEALSTIEALSRSGVEVGSVSISATALATALAIVLGTWLLSAVLRFILEREIFPRLDMRPGAGYAIDTLSRWLIFIAGGVLTLAALGVDATRITLLAGAVGVGIGFGLQTVVNNFVSGLILIIERPVAVGDLIEIGPLLGEIQRIGIRSSSVRTTHGAEVIVPNSDLASKEVINWTRSDRQRRYDIDVGVAYGSDPETVMRLLEEAAREVPEVIPDPAPMAMFRGFGDSSLDFRLLAWVSTIDLGVQAQSALRVAVLRKLDGAGIAIPFPQRDVRLVGPAAPGAG